MKKGVKFTALALAASLMFTYPLCNGITADAAAPLKTVESSNVPTKYWYEPFHSGGQPLNL